MNILIIVRILWTGGAQKVAVREAMELKSQGHNVKILFLRRSFMVAYSDLLSKVNYEILDNGSKFLQPILNVLTRFFSRDRGSESRVDLDLLLGINRIIDARQYDLLICHDQYAAIAGYVIHRNLGTNFVVYLHESPLAYSFAPLGIIANKIEKLVLRSANRIFSLNNVVQDGWRKKLKISSDLNYIGMDSPYSGITHFAHKNFGDLQNVLIAVSFWDIGRKPLIYLDLIENLSEFVLFLVGNWRIPRLKELFIEEVTKRNLKEKVCIYEGVNEEELSYLYSISKFAVRFGFGEHGVGSVAEYIQHGVPPILNEDLGISRTIRDFDCGLVTETVDIPRIQKFIRESNNLRKYEMLIENVERLSNAYSWREHCLKMVT